MINGLDTHLAIYLIGIMQNKEKYFNATFLSLKTFLTSTPTPIRAMKVLL